MPLRITTIRDRAGWYEAKGTVNGKRIRRRYEARTRAEANAIAKSLEQEAWEYRDAGPDPVMFEECALAYMQADKPRQYLAPLIAHFRGRDVNTIKPGEIEDAARAIYPGCKNATLNRQGIAPAQAVINFAAKRGICPPIKVDKLKIDPVKRVAVDRAWIDAFMRAADPHLGALALFMFTTAARIGEATRITWDDVDLHERIAYIAKTKMGQARDALLTHEMVAVIANLPRDHDRVFRYSSRAGHTYRLWREACERAGIAYVPPHQAGRHSFATEMVVRNGVDPVTAAKAGGYSTQVMQKVYAHSERERDAVDDVMGGNIPAVRNIGE